MTKGNVWDRAQSVSIEVSDAIGPGFNYCFDSKIPKETKHELHSFLRWLETEYRFPITLYIDFEYKHYLVTRQGKRVGYLFYWADFDSYPVFDNPDDVDFQIYSKFFSDYDKRLFSAVRKTPPEQRLNLKLDFEDPRCPQMLWRHVCRNYPRTLDPENLKKWKSFSSTRLLCPPGNPINDINFVSRKIEERLSDTSLEPRQKQVLAELKDYLLQLKHYVGLN